MLQQLAGMLAAFVYAIGFLSLIHILNTERFGFLLQTIQFIRHVGTDGDQCIRLHVRKC